MRFVNKTGNGQIDIAIENAERLLRPGSGMILDVSRKKNFAYGSDKVGDPSLELIKERSPIEIQIYTPWNPWTKAIASYSKGVLRYNSRKLSGLTIKDLTGNLIHEWAHHCGYKHGNNYKTADKCLYSVPYYLSENVQRWL